MSTFKLEIVTAEKATFSDDVNALVAPGIAGELGILPHHTPLMTMLQPGELRIRKGADEVVMSVSGGFLEVRPDRVVILADAAERAEEIDVERAQAARRRAEERMKGGVGKQDAALLEAALRRATVRIKVGEKRKSRPGPTV
jgi:F-type H+-transporting ATPase subunit epsilon